MRQKGITLLEILLVVLIAAGIISAAVTYYTQTLGASRVSETAALIEQINKAGHEWLQIPINQTDNYQSNFQNLTSIDNLISLDLLSCPNNSCKKNAWGGTVAVNGDSGSQYQYMTIALSGLPSGDCARLQEQMKNIAPQSASLTKQNSCSAAANGAITYQIFL
jgi:type II secretory pathway pseudopilin PulG